MNGIPKLYINDSMGRGGGGLTIAIVFKVIIKFFSAIVNLCLFYNGSVDMLI